MVSNTISPAVVEGSSDSIGLRLSIAEEKSIGDMDSNVKKPGDDNTDCLVARLDRIYDLKRRCYIDMPASAPYHRRLSPKYGLVVSRQFDEAGNHVQTRIEIRREELRTVFKEILGNATGYWLDGDPATIEPQDLFHAEKELRRRLDDIDTTPSALAAQIKAALDVLDQEFTREKGHLHSLAGEGKITFNLLWAIFPPGCSVCEMGIFGDVKVYQHRGHRTVAGEFCIDVRSIDTDGENWGWTSTHTLKIPEFKGAKPIVSLCAFPLEYHPQKDLDVELEASGIWRAEFPDSGVYKYDGPAFREDNRGGLVEFHCHGRVVFDYKGLRRTQPSSRFVKEIDQIIPREDMGETEYVAFPSVACGYSLQDKCWAAFSLPMIRYNIWKPSIWDVLVLPDSQKQTLLDLAETHTYNMEASAKSETGGKPEHGLVALLTGPAGVGKTTTAQALAEKLEKPLLAFCLGELGYSPAEFDASLQRAMDLVQCWNGILLLDDIDVLVDDPDHADSLHRVLLSIFICRLDLYRGLMLITAKGDKVINSALRGRIHLRIAYHSLSQPARRQVWKTALEEAGAQSELAVSPSDGELDELAGMDVNAREISSAVMQAFARARKRQSKPTFDMLRAALLLASGDKGAFTDQASHTVPTDLTPCISSPGFPSTSSSAYLTSPPKRSNPWSDRTVPFNPSKKPRTLQAGEDKIDGSDDTTYTTSDAHLHPSL